MYLSKELENAIRQGQVDAVQRVLEKGTPLAGYNPSGLVALGVAAAGHTAVVLALIVFGADPDEVDDEGDTAIDHALRKGDYNTLSLLLAHGTAEARAARSITALHKAAERGDVSIVAKLLNSGVPIDSTDRRGVRR